MKSRIFRILTLIAALSMLAAPVGAGPIQNAADPARAPARATPEFSPEPATTVAHQARASHKPGEAVDGIYLIRLADAPLATYQGSIEGLEATNPSVRGETKLDPDSAASIAYRDYLAARQADAISRMEAALGRPVEVIYRYYAANNGFAARLGTDEAAAVARLPGVIFVQPNQERELHTDAGPTWIGADEIWNGTATGGLAGTQGEGIVVGVIDTGINPSNPSFADPGPIDGYSYTNPLGSYVGVCDSTDPTYDPSFPCNNKLIGARGYATVNGGDPTDYDGHGSHTASTAAGNTVTATVTAPTTSTMAVISGVAPHANIIAYGACCTSAALTAAIDDIVLDGVDVVNYSIGSTGCTASDPWNDFDAVGFLNARAAGIFVATSAGNCGPGADTVGSPADVPWLTSVGATTHNRAFLNALVNMTGGGTTPPADIEGRSLTSGYGPASIVYAGDYGDALCAPGAFSPGTFSGEIVVCDRGTYGRVEKGQSVLDGGAGGYVLANVPASGFGVGALNGDSHVLPAVHITAEDGITLKAWLASGSGHTATISGSTLDSDSSYADIVAGFSSRGGNKALADILVPSVAAPGVDIIAAAGTNDAVIWDVISGTSMASPHTAGAGTLLKALHPDWTPAQIQSALMTTASTMAYKTDGVTMADPFDIGSGRVDLTQAGEAGIVLDESIQNYEDADPDLGGDPKTLNLASFGNSQCLQTCSWTREISSTMATTVTWTASTSAPTVTLMVEPLTIELGPYETDAMTVTADVSGLAENQWYFGQVTLTPNTGTTHEANFPVAVQATSGVLPAQVEIDTRRDAGSQTIEDVESVEITDLTINTFGLTVADLTSEMLSEDPTSGDPYDNLNDGTTFYITTTVSSGAKRLVAETTESSAIDMDLFVGTGDTPSAATEVCSSTTPTVSEYCNIDDPAAGTWWVLVQNWDESAAPPDSVTLATAVVPGSDAGNMTVTGPNTVPVGTPYDLQVYWDEPALEAGDRAYGTFDIGSSPGSPGDIGTLPVNLIRHEDDVGKSVSDASPTVGSTLTYTLTVRPNVTDVDLSYTLTDTIPAGLTYVPGSVSASDGAVTVTGSTLTWNGILPSPIGAAGSYNVTTSDTDPSCDTSFGGYVNLEDFAIFTQAGITGDTSAWTAFTSGDPINYVGTDYTGMSFTDDGYGVFDVTNQWTPSLTPWVPQSIPDPTLPNNVLAAYWHDFEIFYDAGMNHGVSLATSGAPGGTIIVEYDDIQLYGGSASVMDFEIVMTRAVDDTPGAYEIVYAYDNISSTPSSATIGWEGPDGTNGGALVNDGDPTGVLSDGFMVCMDYTGPSFSPVTITYQVTAPTEGMFTNTAYHIVDNPGAQQASTSATVNVSFETLYMPIITRND